MTPRVKGVQARTIVMAVIVVLVIGAIGFILLSPLSLSPATVQTSLTSSAGPLASYLTPVNYPVEVISVTGPVPPYPIGDFEVVILLMNVGVTPITSLNATLGWVPPPGTPGGANVQYSFVLNVSSSSPLLPGQSIHTTNAFVGPDLEGGLHYPLLIRGALSDGTQFSYTEEVLFVRFDFSATKERPGPLSLRRLHARLNSVGGTRKGSVSSQRQAAGRYILSGLDSSTHQILSYFSLFF